MEMKRSIHFTPAYDRRGDTPDCGQHPMHLAFVLRGDKGAIVFDINTGWYIDLAYRARPAYYSLVAHDEVLDPHFNEEKIYERCDWLDGNPCIAEHIYGLTGRRLEQLFTGLVSRGEEWLWTELEKEYKERYNEAG